MALKNSLEEKYTNIFEEKLLQEIVDSGQFKRLEKGFSMIDIGDKLEYMPLVIEGAIRVMNEDEKGNEFLLYYLEIGDSCAMTMTCCMGNRKSAIRAITESYTELFMIPVQKMEDWLVKYKSWRAFVFDSYDVRMKEMLEAIDSLAFQNTEERLYKYLKDKAMVLGSSVLDITHLQIANDLNSSRVVISRLMKKLSLDNKIEMNRNEVSILKF